MSRTKAIFAGLLAGLLAGVVMTAAMLLLAVLSLGKLNGPIEVKGIAYGGDRAISRVELSSDGGKSWRDAEIYYSGGNLAWSLWKTEWMPGAAGDYSLVVRATDGKGDVHEWDEHRGPFSGVAGLHEIDVQVTA